MTSRMNKCDDDYISTWQHPHRLSPPRPTPHDHLEQQGRCSLFTQAGLTAQSWTFQQRPDLLSRTSHLRAARY